ncbi:MAG: hypothetical protein QME05_05645 [Candidatus Margulisbacteria bacterium]|nr:hypothetical protein [Candidatus Margulisiibacteriota bacterium]
MITVLSAASLPFCLYYLARKFKFSSSESAVIAFLTMLPIAGLNLACGGTFFSLFIVGLGTNALALPLFLIYIGKLKEEVDRIKEGKAADFTPAGYIFLTILAVAIALSQFVVTFATIMAAAIIILNSFSKPIYLFAAKHAAIVFLICSFFYLPIAAYSKYIEDAGTILSMGFFLTIPMLLLILLGGVASILDKDPRFDRTFFMLIAFFSVALFLDFGQVGLPMHAYRFVIFFLLFAMMLPVKLVINNLGNWKIKGVLLFCFIFLLGWQFKVLLLQNPRTEINYNRLFLYNTYRDAAPQYPANFNLDKLDGRVLLLDAPNRLAPRATEHLLAWKTNNYFLIGMFGDNKNSRYLYSLPAKTLGLFASPPPSNPTQQASYWWQAQNLGKLLKLFQINYILSESPIRNPRLIKRVPVRLDRPPYYLYQIGNNKSAELLAYKPYCAEDNWPALVYNWCQSPDPRLLVKAKSLPDQVAAAGDHIKIVEEKISPARFKFKVTAKQPVPILVRVSYFPGWRASVNGKPTKIYQAAPALMLIYGQGDIILEYRPTMVNYLSYLMVIIGLVFFIVDWRSKLKFFIA